MGAQNCGANTIRTLTALRAKHAKEEEKNVNWGINGETGELADMSALGIWEPLSVKLQVFKTAIETAILLLRMTTLSLEARRRAMWERKDLLLTMEQLLRTCRRCKKRLHL